MLGLLPLVLLGGLAIGYLAPFNTTGNTVTGGINNFNQINITGDVLTNTFEGTNTNVNNDDDDIDNNNNNNDNPPAPPGRRRKRSYTLERDDDFNEYGDNFLDSIGLRRIIRAAFDENFSWKIYFDDMIYGLYALLGTSKDTFYRDFYASGSSISLSDAVVQMSALSRKLHCASKLDKRAESVSGNSCFDRLACSHLADDHLVYNGNIVLRAGEAFSLALFNYADDNSLMDSLQKSADLLVFAQNEECDEMILPCLSLQNDIDECLQIY